jgi:hypothetical protein
LLLGKDRNVKHLLNGYLSYCIIPVKPSTLLRATGGAPASVDLNATFNFQELYSAGLFTRNFKTYGLLVQAVFKSMRLGYILELPSGADSGLNFTSHEITLGFSLPVLSFHDRAMIRF